MNLIPGNYYVGVFCKKPVTLSTKHKKVHGFSEEIDTQEGYTNLKNELVNFFIYNSLYLHPPHLSPIVYFFYI